MDSSTELKKVKLTPEELDKVFSTISPELLEQIKGVRATGNHHPGFVFSNLSAIAASFIGPTAHEDDVVKLAQRLWTETTP